MSKRKRRSPAAAGLDKATSKRLGKPRRCPTCKRILPEVFFITRKALLCTECHAAGRTLSPEEEVKAANAPGVAKPGAGLPRSPRRKN